MKKWALNGYLVDDLVPHEVAEGGDGLGGQEDALVPRRPSGYNGCKHSFTILAQETKFDLFIVLTIK